MNANIHVLSEISKLKSMLIIIIISRKKALPPFLTKTLSPIGTCLERKNMSSEVSLVILTTLEGRPHAQ